MPNSGPHVIGSFQAAPYKTVQLVASSCLEHWGTIHVSSRKESVESKTVRHFSDALWNLKTVIPLSWPYRTEQRLNSEESPYCCFPKVIHWETCLPVSLWVDACLYNFWNRNRETKYYIVLSFKISIIQYDFVTLTFVHLTFTAYCCVVFYEMSTFTKSRLRMVAH